MKWLFGSWTYKLLAMAIALGLWLVAHGSSDHQTGMDVPVEIRGVPEDLVVTDLSADQVNIRVGGTRAGLRNLTPVGLIYPVEVAGAKPGVLTVEVNAGALDLPRGLSVVARSPSHLEITLARKGSKAVEVRPDLDGEPADGYAIAGVEIEPQRVRITGARAEVLRLNQVMTETIDVNGADTDIEREVRLALGGRNVWLEEPTLIRIRVRVVPETPAAPPEAPEARKPA